MPGVQDLFPLVKQERPWTRSLTLEKLTPNVSAARSSFFSFAGQRGKWGLPSFELFPRDQVGLWLPWDGDRGRALLLITLKRRPHSLINPRVAHPWCGGALLSADQGLLVEVVVGLPHLRQLLNLKRKLAFGPGRIRQGRPRCRSDVHLGPPLTSSLLSRGGVPEVRKAAAFSCASGVRQTSCLDSRLLGGGSPGRLLS